MHTKERIIIILLIAIVIVTLATIVISRILPRSLNPIPNSTTISNNETSNVQTGFSSTPTPNRPLLAPIGTFPQSWTREEDPEYAVAYPQDWHSVSFPPLPEEPTELYIAVVPKTVNDDDIFPRLDILFYSATQTTISDQIQKATSLYNTYAKNGSMQQTTVTFQGISATQVSGIINGNAYTQGDPQHKDVVKTFVIFQRGQKVYVVDDAYYNDDSAEQNRQLLLQILATVNFPQ